MARQSVRFNYFVPKIVDSEGKRYPWEMTDFIEYLLGNKRSFNAAFTIGDEVSDLEWNSRSYDEINKLYCLQLSKLRSKNIPSRKKINQDKVPLQLEPDEFLGEFNVLIYDPELNILITQSNFFGLTTKQISIMLSNLRMRFFEADDEEYDNNAVTLEPIIDDRMINRVKENEIYRKIKIKGTDYNEIANSDLDSDVLISAIKSMNKVNGVNFEITISLSHAPRNESLDTTEVRTMIDDVLRLGNEDKDFSMNIASKQDEENAIEYINLLEPRLSSVVVLEVDNRATIGAEFIFQNFKEQNYFNNEKKTKEKARTIVNRI